MRRLTARQDQRLIYAMSASLRCAAAILVSCLLLAGCGKGVKSISGLAKLHVALTREFPKDEISLNQNDTTLLITFVNSSLNSTSSQERAERAKQTATFVVQHYPTISELKEVFVQFIEQKSQFVIFHYSRSLDFFPFDNRGTALQRNEDVKPSEQYTSATYSPTLKQTDIISRNLQLEGDLENGLSLLPHFTVPGNVTPVEPCATFPESVRFDFSSFSEKSIFPGAPKLTFLADQKVVFQTTAQFSTSKFDDKFSEYLSLAVPYPAFLRMTSGNTLTLRIGAREYLFSQEHLNAMREMRAYVKE